MSTIRRQLLKVQTTPNKEEALLNFSAAIENEDVDLSGYIYGLLVSLGYEEILQDYYSLKVYKYKDLDNLNKLCISLAFLQDFTISKENLEREILNNLVNEISALGLDGVFNDINVNGEQWRTC